MKVWFEWIMEHKLCVILTLIFALLGVPLIIYFIFQIPAQWEILESGPEWNEGIVLGYYGSVISFAGTVFLGALALYQNELYRNESNITNEKSEMDKRDRKRPILAFESHEGLQFKIKSINEGVAYNFGVGSADLLLGKRNATLIAEKDTKSSLSQNEVIDLFFTPIPEIGKFDDLAILKLHFQYDDIFGYRVVDTYAVAFNLVDKDYGCSTTFVERKIRKLE